jgi:hypothetical protein
MNPRFLSAKTFNQDAGLVLSATTLSAAISVKSDEMRRGEFQLSATLILRVEAFEDRLPGQPIHEPHEGYGCILDVLKFLGLDECV